MTRRAIKGPMSPDQRRTIYEVKKSAYPHEIWVSLCSASDPKFEHVVTKYGYAFLRIPFIERNEVVWMFRTDEDLCKFVKEFCNPSKPWTPDAPRK